MRFVKERSERTAIAEYFSRRKIACVGSGTILRENLSEPKNESNTGKKELLKYKNGRRIRFKGYYQLIRH